MLSMRSKVKVLNLPICYKSKNTKHYSELIEHKQEILPIFNRDGWYYNRCENFCWIEVNGKAYLEYPEQFIYELKIANHIPLGEKELNAIRVLLNYNSCPKILKMRFEIDKEYKNLESLYRNSRKRLIARLKKSSNLLRYI